MYYGRTLGICSYLFIYNIKQIVFYNKKLNLIFEGPFLIFLTRNAEEFNNLKFKCLANDEIYNRQKIRTTKIDTESIKDKNLLKQKLWPFSYIYEIS